MRFSSFLTVVIFFASLFPAFSAVPLEDEKDFIQTAVAAPVPFNTPSEQPFSTSIDKVALATPDYFLVDLPAKEISKNPAILTNSYQHNVFYVRVTAKAP